MMNDLKIAFTAKEITAFGGVSLLYKMLDNCHFKEALSSVGLPQQGSNRGKSPEQLIYGLGLRITCLSSSLSLLSSRAKAISFVNGQYFFIVYTLLLVVGHYCFNGISI